MDYGLRKNVVWETKHYRCFNRIIAGVECHKKDRLRFLTLSTPPEFNSKITDKFVLLRKRIKRLTVNNLVEKGYLTKHQASYFYGAIHKGEWNVNFKFDYLRVKTSEGVHGVLHILFYGQYLPRDWIFDNWKDVLRVDRLVNQSVDIRHTKSGIAYNTRKLAIYCVSQYVSGQDAYVNFYCSKTWVFEGFGKYFDNLRADYWKFGISLDSILLKNYYIDYKEFIIEQFDRIRKRVWNDKNGKTHEKRMIFHGGYFNVGFLECWGMIVDNERLKQSYLDVFIKPDFEKSVEELKNE